LPVKIAGTKSFRSFPAKTAENRRNRRPGACKDTSSPEVPMQPFHTSLTARLVSVSIAIALAGVGFAAVSGRPELLPYVILLAVGGCVIGTIAGAIDYSYQVMGLVVALPMLLWPYVMAAELIMRRAPSWGWLLIAAGAVIGGVSAFAGMIKPARLPLQQSLSH
jgi:hypothetical protein